MTERFEHPYGRRRPFRISGLLMLLVGSTAASVPAKSGQQGPEQAQGHALRVGAATPNVDAFYIVRADIYRQLQDGSELSSAYGPHPLSAQLRLKPGVNYYIFPRCNGQINRARGRMVAGGTDQVMLECQ